MTAQTASHFSIGKRAQLGLAGFAVAAAAAVPALLGPQKAAVTFEPSAADICTGDRMCDGFQMMTAMRVNGELSLASPVGKALKTIGNAGGVTDERVTGLMQQLDKNLYTTKNVPSIVEVDGMTVIRPPQYKTDATKPYGLDNPFQKANYDFVVMTEENGKCVRHTLRPDGSTTLLADGQSLVKRVSSHAAIDACGPDVQKTYSQMLGM